jgi:GGDEF domain-containing protein
VLAQSRPPGAEPGAQFRSAVRFGGEEFLLVMPLTPAAGAFAAAEKIRQAFEEYEHPEAGVVTASFGVYRKERKGIFQRLVCENRQGALRAKAIRPQPGGQRNGQPAVGLARAS